MAGNAGRSEMLRRANEKSGTTFFPGRRFGMNRQCRGLSMAEYFQTNPAILPEQRDSALYRYGK